MAPPMRKNPLVQGHRPHEFRIVFEVVAHWRPVLEQAARPRESDEAHAEFDSARPVDAMQERICPEPGPYLLRGRTRISLFTGEPERRREQRRLVMARQFPDILRVEISVAARYRDIERECIGGRARIVSRIEMPVDIRCDVV